MTEVMLVYEVRAVEIKVPAASAKRRDELIVKRCCIACEKKLSDSEIVRRGQCNACYQATRRGIKAKVVSEAELIRAGELLTLASTGRHPTNAYTRKIANGGDE